MPSYRRKQLTFTKLKFYKKIQFFTKKNEFYPFYKNNPQLILINLNVLCVQILGDILKNVPPIFYYMAAQSSGLRPRSAKPRALIGVSSNLTAASMGDGEMVAATEPLTEICENLQQQLRTQNPSFCKEHEGSNPVSRFIGEPFSNFIYLYIIDLNEITKSK